MTDRTSSYYAEIGGDFKGIQGDISGGTINQYIIAQKSGVEITSQPLIPGSPYVGLTKFKGKDKDKFFGRDGQILSLSNYLEQNKLLLLMGVSGSGKSSLILAGLIPHFEDKWGTTKFSPLIFDPTEDPFKSLDRNIPNEYRHIVGDLTSESTEDILVRLVDGINQDYERQLIFIDQFEELFTLTPPDKQELFIKCLLRLIEQKNSSIHLVMTMRSDFLGSLSPYPELATVLERHIRIIKDMTRNELRLSIAEPAARNHVIFEGNLVEIIIDDFLGQAGSLPLLQYTLDLLWQRDKELDGLTDQVLNLSTYQDKDFGGVGGALQKQANIIYKKLNADEQKVAQKIFLELVDIVDEKRVSKPVELKTFQDGGVQEKVVNILIEKRLLVRGTDESDKTGIVQVSHEELLRSWDILDALFREKEDILLLRRRLVTDAKEWDELRKQDPRKAINALILNVPKLTKIINLAKEQSLPNLDALTTEFIKASIKYQNQVQTIEAERKQREVSTELSLANSLGRYSSSLFDTHHELEAFVEAIKAGKILQKYQATDTKVINAFNKVLSQSRERNRLEGHQDDVTSVSFSPDGKTIATASSDGTAQLWNLQGELLQEFQGHQSQEVTSVSFSPDGKTIATASSDRTARLWNLQGELLQEFQGHQDSVNSVSFSPDGKTIATASFDKTARLWNLQGQLLQEFQGHQDGVNSVSFSPDGKTIVTASYDNTARLWNLQGELLQEFQGHQLPVDSVSFSPDGKTIATASSDGTARLWNLKKGELLQEFQGHHDGVNSVSFSHDGKTIATASSDGTARLWNLKGELLQEFQGHHDGVNSASFSPDGKTIATASDDRTGRLWNLQGELLQEFQGHQGKVKSVSFSLDGKTIATASYDNTARLWPVRNLDRLLEDGCNWVRDYLTYNPNISESDKHLCDGIGAQK
ncbi:nSTAND1 domain-containing NTPase [Nostoc sp.]